MTITGAQLLLALGLLCVDYMFIKGGLPNNKHQNQQWRDAMRHFGIKDKDLWRRLHDEMRKHPFKNEYSDLIELLEKILRKWGKL